MITTFGLCGKFCGLTRNIGASYIVVYIGIKKQYGGDLHFSITRIITFTNIFVRHSQCIYQCYVYCSFHFMFFFSFLLSFFICFCFCSFFRLMISVQYSMVCMNMRHKKCVYVALCNYSLWYER